MWRESLLLVVVKRSGKKSYHPQNKNFIVAFISLSLFLSPTTTTSERERERGERERERERGGREREENDLVVSLFCGGGLK